MKIGLLGHGTIGIGVDRIVKKRDDMEVTKILSLVVDDEMAGRTAASIDDIVEDPMIDTVVEVMGGIHPAFEFIKSAMEHGKNVVTANKAVVAACYDELLRLAEENRVSFRCTAAVGGSIPWLVNIERAKRVNHIAEVDGIMNGTTNFILHKMFSERAEFAETLKEAQDLGYAEKDPSADIDGFDIRRKIQISANVAFDVSLNEEEIQTFGIRNVRLRDIEWGMNRGLTLKLTASAVRMDEEDVSCFVCPTFLEKDDIMAAIPRNYNLVSYTGSYCGTQSFIGEGAGRFPTAHNVVGDLADISENPETFYTVKRNKVSVNNAAAVRKFYIRTAGEKDSFLKFAGLETMEKDVYLTDEVRVSDMLFWAERRLKTDPDLFIAARD